MKKAKKIILIISLLIALFLTISSVFSHFLTTSNFSNKFHTISYNFKVDGNGGIYSSNSVNVVNGKVSLPIPFKTGYSFNNYDLNGNDYTANDINVLDINNKTLTAEYTINKYSLNIHPYVDGIEYATGYNDFTFCVFINDVLVAPNVTSYSNNDVEYGSKVRVLVNPHDGYNISSFSDNTWIINDSLNIAPSWTKIEIPKYIVDVNPIINGSSYSSGSNGFNFSIWLNGVLVGDYVTDYYNENIEQGSTIRVLVHNKSGYSITSFIDNTWTVNSALNIEPSWSENLTNYSISYDPNGGWFGGGQNWSLTQYFTYHEGTGALDKNCNGYDNSNPIRDGYTFEGWSPSPNEYAHYNQTVYAQWKYNATNTTSNTGIYLISTRKAPKSSSFTTWSGKLDGHYTAGQTSVHSGNWYVTVNSNNIVIQGTNTCDGTYYYHFTIYAGNNTSGEKLVNEYETSCTKGNKANATISW